MKCPSCGSNLKEKYGKMVCNYCGYESEQLVSPQVNYENLQINSSSNNKKSKLDENDENMASKYDVMQMGFAALLVIVGFVAVIVMMLIAKM